MKVIWEHLIVIPRQYQNGIQALFTDRILPLQLFQVLNDMYTPIALFRMF
jgi:hypothetical protein